MTRSPLTNLAATRLPIVALTALFALLGATPALTGCAGEGDVDRTQPNKIDKLFFVNADGSPKTLFPANHRRCPPDGQRPFEGLQGEMNRSAFEVKETVLLGYRA